MKLDGVAGRGRSTPEGGRTHAARAHDGEEVDRERSLRLAAEERADRLARELEEARAEAARAAKSRDQFISSVSHDLRGPIGTVLTWAQLLRGGLLPEEKRERALDAIERGARAQVRLLECLVDLARLRAGTLSYSDGPVDLSAAARAAVEKTAPVARAKGVQVEIEPAVGDVTLQGDGDRLAQAIAQLVDNAIRATPEGGRVGVRLRRDGAQVEVEVTDTGSGLDPEQAENLIAGARDTEASREARRGLGLPLALGLVERHAGSLRLESAGAGRGTVARVRLPADARPASAAQPSD
ncbi:MAG TPA: HAMP domain-containing sensor histidine kinase [Candidatus Binatia bacterium]|nr:HAMP domain-containing sensor histidine kinase [Candidatus Binatia bacterium]